MGAIGFAGLDEVSEGFEIKPKMRRVKPITEQDIRRVARQIKKRRRKQNKLFCKR